MKTTFKTKQNKTKQNKREYESHIVNFLLTSLAWPVRETTYTCFIAHLAPSSLGLYENVEKFAHRPHFRLRSLSFQYWQNQGEVKYFTYNLFYLIVVV